mmetsp:Transcript_27599/g.47929  ORF Transcript_27599/g.47929 Transcript_27599/m.47929 type:complete len:598 (+) Transcript_27599:86-1879(+)
MAWSSSLSVLLLVVAHTITSSAHSDGFLTREDCKNDDFSFESDEFSCLQLQLRLDNTERKREAMAVKNATQNKTGVPSGHIIQQILESLKSSSYLGPLRNAYESYAARRRGENSSTVWIPPRSAIPVHSVVFDAVVQEKTGNAVMWTIAFYLVTLATFCLLVFSALLFKDKDSQLQRQEAEGEGLKTSDVVFSVAGNTLEWFDFGLYGFFVNEIGDAYFPTGDKFTTILIAFGSYAGGYFMRPIGGLLFGYIGDCYGRVVALQIALAGMVCCTSVIGLLPPYSQIGFLAPLLAMSSRLVQGVSVGGQQVGASIYMMERSEVNRRCFFSGVLSSSVNYGMVLASAAAAVVDAFGHTWCWRLPFLSAVFFGLAGAWSSMKAEEANDFVKRQKGGQLEKSPISQASKQNWPTMLQIIAMCALYGFFSQAVFVWMPTYQFALKSPPMYVAFELNTIAFAMYATLMLFWGWLADHGNWEALFICAAMLLTILFPLVFVFFDSTYPGLVFATYAVLLVPFAGFASLIPRWLVDRAPDPSTRFVTLGLAYGTGMAIFAGTGPVICTLFAGTDWGLMGLGFFLGCMGAVSTIVLPFRQQQVVQAH